MVDLDLLAKLHCEATAAPWRAYHLEHHFSLCSIAPLDGNPLAYFGPSGEVGHVMIDACPEYVQQDIRNAELIVAIRNALPALIEELRVARGMNADGTVDEPTEAMQTAFNDIAENYGHKNLSWSFARDAYEAMVAARGKGQPKAREE